MTTSEIFNNILMVIGAIALGLLITVFLWKILDEISDRKKLKKEIALAEKNLLQNQIERIESISEQCRILGELTTCLSEQIQLGIQSDRNQDKMIIELKRQLDANRNNRSSNNNG